MSRFTTFLFVIALILGNHANSQNAFYDAKKISTIERNQLVEMTDESINYIFTIRENKTVKDFLLFMDNPFDTTITSLDYLILESATKRYEDYLEQMSIHENEEGYYYPPPEILLESSGSSSSRGNSLLSGLSSFGSQQTMIIDELTKYYAEEFKKAQLLTFMQIFKETIGKFGELQILFPETYHKLLNADPSRFPELGNEYKTVFYEDLIHLPSNFVNHIDNFQTLQDSVFKSKFKWLNEYTVHKIKESDSYNFFKISMDIGTQLTNMKHPQELFASIDKNYYSKKLVSSHEGKSDQFVMLFHGINLIQKNLIDTTKTIDNQFTNIWLSAGDLNSFNTLIELKYFIGFIYHQDRDFFDKFIFTFPKTENPKLFDQEIIKTAEIINLIHTKITELQNYGANLTESNYKDNFSNYMGLFLETIKSVKLVENSSLHNRDLNNFYNIGTYTIKLFDNIRKQDYSDVMYYFSQIITEILNENDSRKRDVVIQDETWVTQKLDTIQILESEAQGLKRIINFSIDEVDTPSTDSQLESNKLDSKKKGKRRKKSSELRTNLQLEILELSKEIKEANSSLSLQQSTNYYMPSTIDDRLSYLELEINKLKLEVKENELAILELEQYNKDRKSTLDILDRINKYGTFMADVMTGDEEDIKEIIKKHAAPPTSFIFKRERTFTLSITGQPGYFISAERLEEPRQKFGFTSGITLPMGFEFSFRVKNRTSNSHSIGLFLQLIDLGSILNFRLSDDTSVLPEKVTFQQFFSPGASINFGIKNSPVNIGIGYQYTPPLRKITLETGNEFMPNAHRLFLRIAWDIPFINIWKTKN